MKKSVLYFSAIFLTASLFTACNEAPEKPHVTWVPTSVPLDTAIKAIENYGRYHSVEDSVANIPVIQAFLIKKEDLLGALGLSHDADSLYPTPYKQGRAYVGLVEGIHHLYFVPVDDEGNDIIPGTPDDQHVYDLIAPCPNTCDKSSPLYKAFSGEF